MASAAVMRMGSGGDPERSARRNAAYRAARRHSRLVRLLKIAIPLGAGLATLFVLLVMVFDPFRRLPPGVDIASIGLDGAKIVMDAPRLSGFRKDARPYEVTARSASQDIRSPHLVELRDLKARLSLGAEGEARLSSPLGVLDSQKEVLDLKESVSVITDNGYDVRLRSARIEFRTGNVRSAEPVTMLVNDGSVEADSLEIIDGGRQIVFSGRVRSVLTPPPDKRAGGQTAQAEEAKQ